MLKSNANAMQPHKLDIEKRRERAKKLLAEESRKKNAEASQRLASGETTRGESYLAHRNEPLKPKPFDAFDVLLPDDFVIHNGTRRTGKTWLDRYFMFTQRHVFRAGEVFTNTPMNGFWQKHFPDWKVFHGFQPGVVQAIVKEQDEIVKLFNRFPEKVNPYRIIIFEDCANDLTHAQELEDLASYARHLCLSVHVITQHPQKLAPLVRSNADIVTAFPLHTHAALECLRADYLGTLDPELAMDALTSYAWKSKKASQALVIVPRMAGGIHQRTFVIVAPDPGPFQIGCKEYWEGLSTVPTEEEVAQWEAEDRGESDDKNEFDEDMPHAPAQPASEASKV